MTDNKNISSLEQFNFESLHLEYNITEKQIAQKQKEILNIFNGGEFLESLSNPTDFIDHIVESIAATHVQSRIETITRDLMELQKYKGLLIARITEMVDTFTKEFDPKQMPIEQVLRLGELLYSFKEQQKRDPMIRLHLEKAEELKTPLKDLDVSVRTYNCLRAVDLDTLDQIVDTYKNMGPDKFLKGVRNLGRKSLQEIETMLRKRGLIE